MVVLGAEHIALTTPFEWLFERGLLELHSSKSDSKRWKLVLSQQGINYKKGRQRAENAAANNV